MVTDDEKAQIRLCMDALREGIEGFRSRRPQLEMIATVATTLAACRGEADPPADGEHIAVGRSWSAWDCPERARAIGLLFN